MPSVSPIPTVYKSIIRATSDFIESVNLSGDFDTMGYHNWEQRGEEDKLPTTTLLGVEGFSFDENNGLWLVRYGLGLSSYKDYDLLNEIDLVGLIHERFGKDQKIDLRDQTNGEVNGQLVVTEFLVMPMGQSEIRNYRTIGIELNRATA